MLQETLHTHTQFGIVVFAIGMLGAMSSYRLFITLLSC